MKKRSKNFSIIKDAGDVEKSVEFFNAAQSGGEGMSMMEDKKSKKSFKKYSYTGPIYYNGIKISNSSNMFTMAVSKAKAIQNFIHKAANGDIRANYDIIDELVSEVTNPDDDTSDFEIDRDPPTCEYCGSLLSDNGTCPVCDEGEEEYSV